MQYAEEKSLQDDCISNSIYSEHINVKRHTGDVQRSLQFITSLINHLRRAQPSRVTALIRRGSLVLWNHLTLSQNNPSPHTAN